MNTSEATEEKPVEPAVEGEEEETTAAPAEGAAAPAEGAAEAQPEA